VYFSQVKKTIRQTNRQKDQVVDKQKRSPKKTLESYSFKKNLDLSKKKYLEEGLYFILCD
jgi:predicted transcriptional regulator